MQWFSGLAAFIPWFRAERSAGHCAGAAAFANCDFPLNLSVRPGTDEAVLAYSSLQGVHIIHRDLAARNTISSSIIDGTTGGGVFIKTAMMGDGSVLVSHCNPASRMIAIIRESPSLPAIQLPAVQFPTGVECDDQDLWVSPDDLDGDGFHDLALVTLTNMSALSGRKSRELTGHVALIK